MYESMANNGKRVSAIDLARDFNWRKLSLEERQQAKAGLNEFVACLSQVLQADAKKGIYLTNKETVIRSRDVALAYQKSLEFFERIHGEMFSPKPHHRDEPAFIRSFEASLAR